MKFTCLNLWLEEVCTDDTNANNDDDKMYIKSMIVYGSLVDKPNEPKMTSFKEKAKRCIELLLGTLKITCHLNYR